MEEILVKCILLQIAENTHTAPHSDNRRSVSDSDQNKRASQITALIRHRSAS